MRHLLLFILTLALAALALAAGRNWLAPADLLQMLAAGPEGAGRMIWSLRLPRLLVGLIAGAAFGLAGAVFQTLLRNPLASPDVIGVSQTAALGAVLALLAGLPVTLGAWVGGISAVVLLGWLALIVATYALKSHLSQPTRPPVRPHPSAKPLRRS